MNSTMKRLIGFLIFVLAGSLRAQNIEQKISKHQRSFDSPLYQIENQERQKQSTVRVKTKDGGTFIGTLRFHPDSTVQIPDISGASRRLGIAEIEGISQINESAAMKNIGWGFGSGFTIGSTWGLVSPIGTEHDFTRGERFAAFGLGCGAIGSLITGSFSILKSVDVDIPWQHLSQDQQRNILSQLDASTYRYGMRIRFSPIFGNISMPKRSAQLPDIEATNLYGANVRLHLKPRAGIELAFAKTGWFNERSGYAEPDQRSFFSSRSRIDYYSTKLFVALSHDNLVNPFAAWGVALVRETTDRSQRIADEMQSGEFLDFRESGSNTFLPVQIQIGGEIPITRWLSLNGRAGFLWFFWQSYGYLGYQLALSFGQKF